MSLTAVCLRIPGTCGEWIQTLDQGKECLVSLPINRYTTVTLRKTTEVLAKQSQAELLPDLFILAAGGWVSYHRKFAKPASLAMIGQHGGISEKEIAVPIIKLASYSSSLLVP